MMITKRPFINKLVTDALIARKSAAITYVVLSNDGAELSETSFVTIIGECTGDAQIGNLLAARKDLPPELKRFLDAYKQEGRANGSPPQGAALIGRHRALLHQVDKALKQIVAVARAR